MSDFKFSRQSPLRNMGHEVLFGDGGQREVALLYAHTTAQGNFQTAVPKWRVFDAGGSVNGSRNSYDLVCLPLRWPGYSDGWHMILVVAIILPSVLVWIAAGWISTQLGGWVQLYSGVRSLTVCSSTSPLAAVSPVSVRLPSWHQYLPYCLATCSSVKFLVRFSGVEFAWLWQHFT